MVSYGLAMHCQIGNHRHCLAQQICSCHCHRKGRYGVDVYYRDARYTTSCAAGLHEECPPIYCTCWCHKIERVKEEVSIKHYELELKNLNSSRAEFREAERQVEGTGIVWGSITLHNDSTPPVPTHTWVIPRAEWEEMGRPLTVYLKVSNAR